MRRSATSTLTACLLMACMPGITPTAAGQAAEMPTSDETQARDAARSGRDTPLTPATSIRLNFQGTPLAQVLDYLGKSAGFVIVREAPIEGTVDVLSHNPLTSDEAVEVLNTVLSGKGLAAIRTGKTLRIVTRGTAKTQDLPVRYGAEPEEIEKSDEMITQIVPVRHADASKLIDNLKPLLGKDATIGANESSNAVIITDSQTNIRRYVSIIKYLDTSISMITEIRVFPLKYAEADELATVVNEIFQNETSTSQQRSGTRGRMAEMFMRMRGRGAPGEQDNTSSSEAREAASNVKAVGDEHSNCLVVGAPKEVLDTIEELIRQIDVPKEDMPLLRVFSLRYADAETITESINDLFESDSSSSSNQGTTRTGGSTSRMMGGPGSRMGGGGRDTRGGQTDSRNSGDRSLNEADVRAVADTRTNSVVVSASEETMGMIEKIVMQLDDSPQNISQVYIYRIQHADLEKLKEVLEGMFEDLDTGSATTGTRTGTQTSRTNQTTPFQGN